MRTGRFLLGALPLALALGAPALADTRTENIDIMVALDRSLSMEQKIGDVQNYVTDTLIDQVLIPGDFLVVVAFYGKTEVVVSKFVRTAQDRAAVKAAINGLKGNGRFTDIGNALDALKGQIAKYEADGRRKYVLLLTDGIQEAPPTSKYWSKDGSFNHAFLQNTKTIQQKGWKIVILGVGGETAVRDLAQALEGSYSEIAGSASADEIRTRTENLLGTITLEQSATRLGPVAPDGTAELSLALSSTGYTNPVTVNLASVEATPEGGPPAETLPKSPVPIEVAPSGTTTARIPLRLPGGMPTGGSTLSLAFQFGAGERFAPTSITLPFTVRAALPFTVPGWIGNSPVRFGGAAAGALIVLAALVVLVVWLVRRGGMQFSVLVDGEAIPPGVARLARGGRLYLSERENAFRLAASRTGRSIARLAAVGSRLSLELLKPDRFHRVKEMPADARGARFTVKSSDGSRHRLEIKSRED